MISNQILMKKTKVQTLSIINAMHAVVEKNCANQGRGGQGPGGCPPRGGDVQTVQR